MKYLKYILGTVLTIWISSLAISYSLHHGEMQMDRILAHSDDRSTLFIGEMSRQQILWFVYVHSYEFNIYASWVNKHENISFYSLSKDIEPNNQLKSYTEKHNYETTTSQISLTYELASGSNLNITTDDLNASFITKTDPNYFRYMSNGSGTVLINGIKLKSQILSDTIISGDSSYAYLKEWTEVNGYMGWLWGTGWAVDYFDISEIVQKWIWETYEDHSYILSIDWGQKSRKEYGIEISEEDGNFIVLQNNIIKLKVDMNNIIKIWQWYTRDAYYYFSGARWDGSLVSGFLNFVR
jgi:hypothetical protein